MHIRWFIVLLILALSACGENPGAQKGEKGDQGPPDLRTAGPFWTGRLCSSGRHERNNHSFRGQRVSPSLHSCMRRG